MVIYLKFLNRSMDEAHLENADQRKDHGRADEMRGVPPGSEYYLDLTSSLCKTLAFRALVRGFV